MTSSTEKRSKRRQSKIYRALNRASRINIIKAVKNLFGDGSHPQSSRAIKQKKAAEAVKNETATIMVTPYGSFERYEQLELLDRYEPPVIKLELEVPPIISVEVTPEIPAEISNEEANEIPSEIPKPKLTASQKRKADKYKKNMVVEVSQKATEIADTSIEEVKVTVTASKEAKTDNYGVREIDAIEFLKYSAHLGFKLFLFPFSLCLKIILFIWSKTPKFIKNGSRSLDKKMAGLLVGFIDHVDVAFGSVDDKLVAVETKVANKLAILKGFFIRLRDRLYAIQQGIAAKARQFKSYSEKNKKRLAIISSGTLAVTVSIALFIGSISGYEYAYNGKPLGLVKNQNDVYITLDVIGDKLEKQYNAKIIIDRDINISLKRVIGLNLDLDSREEVLNKFTYLKDMEVKAYAIHVNGKQVALLESKESADEILSKIQNTYLKKSDRIKYDQVGFAEKVEIKEALTKIGNIQEQEHILEYMLTGALVKKKHTVKSGETFSEIAKNYGISQKQLMESNPTTVPRDLHIGQELILTAAAPILTVQTIETAEYDQSIPYSITYENTEAKYKGEQSVKSRGIDGKKKVVAKIVRNNGIEVSRTELSSVIAFEPVAQVVLVGTKKLPPLVGTGTFITPTRGVITSRFGTRWGRLHEGIDIGVRVGTSVRASDGGTVIFSGRDGGYGNVIRINHGGNRVTVYAHCSKLLVKKGTKVFQGQEIAYSGNTGSSTGPHLHFEIRINGRAVNPSKYL